MPVARVLTTIADRQHQVWSVHTPCVSVAVPTTEPHQRHSVRRRHAAPVHNLPEVRVLLALHHGVHVAHVDIMSRALLNPTVDFRDSLLQIDGVDADTKDVDAGKGCHLEVCAQPENRSTIEQPCCRRPSGTYT